MSRRVRRRPVLAAALVLSLALVLAAAELRVLLVVGVVFAAGWLARGWFRPATPTRPVLRVADDRDRLAAELDDARRSIAKLEAQAAENDQLLGDLEAAAGRPVELIIQDYRRIQRQYGPAAVGKPGRQP